MNLQKIISVLRRLIHPASNAPEGERAAARAKLALLQRKTHRPVPVPRDESELFLNPDPDGIYGRRWCRREMRYYQRGDPRGRLANYRAAKKLLGIREEIGK